MALSLARWLRPALSSCMLCGRAGMNNARTIGVRHPEPAAVLGRLCSLCYAAIPWIAKPACMICGRSEDCPDCRKRTGSSITFSRCAVRYDDRMKNLLALYKYRGSEKLEQLMASILAYAFERICAELAARGVRPQFHLITYVPLAKERLMERGFNQAERMAAILAEWYGLDCREVLKRNRHTAKQSLKTRQNRLTDLRGTFTANFDHVPRSLQASSNEPIRILLTDDIYTTGSTLNECADTLQKVLTRVIHIPQEKLEIYGLIWARS